MQTDRAPLPDRHRKTEAVWLVGAQLEFTITTLVISRPRQVWCSGGSRADVDLVLPDGGEVRLQLPMTERWTRPATLAASPPGLRSRGWCVESEPGPFVVGRGS